MIGGGTDSYNREPNACRFCNRPQGSHGYMCIDGRTRWTAPQDWLILARMRIRRTDPLRWIPYNDYRMYGRKWKS